LSIIDWLFPERKKEKEELVKLINTVLSQKILTVDKFFNKFLPKISKMDFYIYDYFSNNVWVEHTVNHIYKNMKRREIQTLKYQIEEFLLMEI
jgi:hypothetical protein